RLLTHIVTIDQQYHSFTLSPYTTLFRSHDRRLSDFASEIAEKRLGKGQCDRRAVCRAGPDDGRRGPEGEEGSLTLRKLQVRLPLDWKRTRLNSSHEWI